MYGNTRQRIYLIVNQIKMILHMVIFHIIILRKFKEKKLFHTFYCLE